MKYWVSKSEKRMAKLKYSTKFIVISMLFLLPILMLGIFWTMDRYEDILQVRDEIEGTEVVSKIYPLILDVQSHRGLINGYKNGDTASLDQIHTKQSEIAAKFEETINDVQKEKLMDSYSVVQSAYDQWKTLLAQVDRLAVY